MSEQAEQPVKREYGVLDQPEKVRAILGAVEEPVSRELALDLGGVNYSGLDEVTKKAVDSVFNSKTLDVSGEESDKRYRLNDEEREKLSSAVDMKSVHRVISDKILGDLGIEF